MELGRRVAGISADMKAPRSTPGNHAPGSRAPARCQPQRPGVGWARIISEPGLTQQYLIGQFSLLLGDLEAPPGELLTAVKALRREVERSPVSVLPRLARHAIGLTDAICWAALEQGDTSGFCDCAAAAAALGEFANSVDFLRE
jgi:hypothetical protein